MVWYYNYTTRRIPGVPTIEIAVRDETYSEPFGLNYEPMTCFLLIEFEITTRPHFPETR